MTPAKLVTTWILETCTEFAERHPEVFVCSPTVAVSVRDGVVHVDLAMDLRVSALEGHRADA